MKRQVLHTIWCNISGEAAGEIWHLISLGSSGWRSVRCASHTPRYNQRDQRPFKRESSLGDELSTRAISFQLIKYHQVTPDHRDLVFHQLLSLLHTKHFCHPHIKYNSQSAPFLASIRILNRPHYHSTVGRQSPDSRPTVVLATECRATVGDKMSANCRLTHRPTVNRQLAEFTGRLHSTFVWVATHLQYEAVATQTEVAHNELKVQ